MGNKKECVKQRSLQPLSEEESLWIKALNISWSDKVYNEEVLRRVGEDREIISVINRRHRVWLGHTLRHGGLVP